MSSSVLGIFLEILVDRTGNFETQVFNRSGRGYTDMHQYHDISRILDKYMI